MIPLDEAKSDEARDSVVHFCGLECDQPREERQKARGKVACQPAWPGCDGCRKKRRALS
ncbi:MAG: DUF3330 domain-containing protein [Chromatiales bacterium]